MRPQFVSFGEALTDLVTQGGSQFLARPGGAPWNVARACAALGVPSAWAGALSQDSLGDALAQASAAAGLDARFIQRYNAAPLLAIVDRIDPPHYFFVGENSADLHFQPAALPAGWDHNLDWAHFGGISLVREPLASTLESLAERLKAQGTRLSYDPNHRALMGPQDQPRLLRFLARADVIKVSDEDLVGYFPQAAPADTLAHLLPVNPEALWLYTRGAQGATLFAPGHAPLHQPARPVAVVDTVGAGDASLAGLLWSVRQGGRRAPADHLHAALTAAMLACGRAGAAAPTQAELVAAL